MTHIEDLTVEALARTIAPLVEEEPGDIAPDTNLFELGLDSLGLMQVVNGWRQRGIDVNFADLAMSPTLAAWSGLLTQPPTSHAGSTAPAEGDGGGEGELFGLALMQRAYWVGRDPGQPLGGVAAHLYTEFDAPGPVDPERLRAAFERVIARHDTLRLVVTPDGQQRVAASAGWRGLAVHDLRRLDAAEADDRLARLRHEMSHQMLDIEGGEVFAAALTLRPDGSTRLHLDIDMVAADAVSYRTLLADLADAYADPAARRPPLGISFRRYLADRPLARATAHDKARRWWQERLPGLPSTLTLPLVDDVPDGPPRVARRSFVLPAGAKSALFAASRRRAVTPAVTLATAFAEVVGRWSAETRFLLNVPLFDRAPVHPDIGQVVGDFSSSVLLAVDLAEPAPFTERALTLQARLHEDAAHADHSGVEVLRDLTRHHGRQVLAPVVFTSALSLGELFGPQVRRYFGDPVWIVSQGPQVLLDAQVTELDDGLLVNWDSREERFVPGVLDAMFVAFERLVGELAADATAWRAPATSTLPEVESPRPRPAVPPERPRPTPVAPRTPLERVVAQVWGEVLGLEVVGVDDELFALGGDSVLAATIVADLRDVLDTTSVTIRSLFAAPTVAQLVERMLADEPDPDRLHQVAAIVLEIEAMSDEAVAAEIERAAR